MAENTNLVRGLGLAGAVSVSVGTMIGTGIFLVPSDMLRAVGSVWVVLAAWAFAGVLSLCGAMGYAELGAAIPEAGGEYVYLRRAYGPPLAFLYGWTEFIVAKTGSIAALATGFALYLAYFFPRLTLVLWQARVGLELRFTGVQLAAVGMIVFLSIVNILGVRGSGALQTAFTAGKIGVLVLLIAFGLAEGHGSFSHFRVTVAGSMHGGVLAAFGVATISALWGYDGWNNLSMVAGEVENPQRNLVLGLVAGTVLVATIYILVNVAYFYLLPVRVALHTNTIAADAARAFLGKAGGAFIAVGVLVSTFASLNGSILSGSRIPYAQARDGLFPKALAGVHPRFRTPIAAIVAQAVVAGLLALGGTYQALFTKVIFAEFLFYALVTGGLFVLRRREPNLRRPYHTWGYPVVPGVFIFVSILLLINTFREQRADALWGLALVASGVPAYYFWKRVR